MYTIYKLINPFNNDVFYVGRTTATLPTRFYQHLTHAKYPLDSNNMELYKYMNAILVQNAKPIIEEIEKTEDETREDYYINLLGQKYVLFNSCQKKKRELQIVNAAQADYERSPEYATPFIDSIIKVWSLRNKMKDVPAQAPFTKLVNSKIMHGVTDAQIKEMIAIIDTGAVEAKKFLKTQLRKK